MDLAEWLDGSDALAALDAAAVAAWAAVDEDLLALCRDRVAVLLGDTRRRDPGPAEGRSVTARERAALDFTEQYIVDVSSMSNEQAERLGEHLGDEGLVTFVNALLVIEQRMTLELALEAVLR